MTESLHRLATIVSALSVWVAYPMQGRKVSAGDYLRATARNEFGRGIASRWFA